MAWVADATAVQFPLSTVVKQQVALPASNMFTGFPENRVLRVFQIGALQTQEEVMDILRSGLFDIFNMNCLLSYRYAYQDELMFALDAVLYWASTWRRAQSIGDRMQNLVLRDEAKAREAGKTSVVQLVPALMPTRGKLLVHAILSVLVPYLVRKLQRKSLEEDWEREEAGSIKIKLAKALRLVSVAWAALSLLNTLHFLATAQYRTLVERMLSLRLVYGSQVTQRFTNLMYLNQHVSWQTWSSFFSVLNIGRYLGKLSRSMQAFTTASGGSALKDNVCCACNDRPNIAQRSNCGHLYCYYCIKSRLLDPRMAGSFLCPRCGTTVHTALPLQWQQGNDEE
ncbi:putative DNA repair protein [Trypanosoma grayi]|uniref:putative DNA repair protein n=1 Tax=Trypanosoma grayi TaxID=71804 RepID=UPI0004F45481|nr:putative DNA repair protein [Trypanosoma grayi]KEG13199.1 putative DNA repair protein [Trypanosoma grayi]